MLLSNFIQLVGCCGPSGLIADMYEIASRKWVAVRLLGSIWIADMLIWNLIQLVSHSVLSGLHFNCWHATINFIQNVRSVCTLGSILIADILPWNPIQEVSNCMPSGLDLNCWHATMKSHPGCELSASWAPFQLLICCHSESDPESELLHALWALWISDMLLWNSSWSVAMCLLGFI